MSEEPKSEKCGDCRGSGKYVGLWIALEECRTCGGTGKVRSSSAHRDDDSLLPHCRASAVKEEEPQIPKTPSVVRTNVDLRKTWSKMFNPATAPAP